MKELFYNWLNVYPKHQYTDTTIKKYIRALERAEEWLQIVLSKQVLSTENVEEFEKVEHEIKSRDDYDMINRSHGNGDLSAALNLYRKFLEDRQQPGDTWWPSADEYDPHITKQEWMQLLNDPEVFPQASLEDMACFYDIGGAASCVQLEETYGKHCNYYSLSCGVHLAIRILNKSGRTACNQRDAKYWPVLFVGRYAAKDERGNYIWKLRNELYEALTEFGIEKYMPKAVHPVGSFYSWDIINEQTAVKHCDKSFFLYNGSGVPKEICWFFDAEEIEVGSVKPIHFIYDGVTYDGKLANDTTDRRRIRVFWENKLGQKFTAYSKADGVLAYFERVSEDTYRIRFVEEQDNMMESTKDIVENIRQYINSKGFTYEAGLIENFYLSLKSKPFVILAGTSGTGKTKLVKLFAEAVGATSTNGRYKMVSVRPDWSDSTDLFGHVDLNGRFIPGAIIDFLKQAELHEEYPYFLCLDEMNLARVEYYLSDILSVIETREFDRDRIMTEPLVSESYFGADTNAAGRYGTVRLPENLYLIGTVNMDETTFPFSRKVLDRANTIEFSYVDLMAHSFDAEKSADPQTLKNSFLKSEYLLLSQCSEDADSVDEYCSELQEINRILANANAHVGYRVRDEIVFYMLNNKHAELISEHEAMDHEIMQKILPRIQGSSMTVKKMLCELFKHCWSDFSGYQTDDNDVASQMFKALKSSNGKYRRSAEKIAFMVRRFEEDGFTSYWL